LTLFTIYKSIDFFL